MSSENRGGGFFAGFVLGAIAGGLAAALLSQDDTRDMMVGKAREAGNLAKNATGDLRESAADLYERGRQVVENARSNFSAAVEEGSASADSLREELQRNVEG
jgi:gas vesicle protein